MRTQHTPRKIKCRCTCIKIYDKNQTLKSFMSQHQHINSARGGKCVREEQRQIALSGKSIRD